MGGKMNISDMVKVLEKIKEQYGDLQIIQQADQEGNGYDWCRGAEVGYLTEDMEHCYSSEEDAVSDDQEEWEEVVVIYP